MIQKDIIVTKLIRAALTGKHDTLVRRAHQMLNAALKLI